MGATAGLHPWSPPRPEPYPERADPKPHWLDVVETVILAGPRAGAAWWDGKQAQRRVMAVSAGEAELQSLSDEDLLARVGPLRDRLRRDGLEGPAVIPVLALIRELSRRLLGLRHHDVQILGGLSMLSGRVAEMDTGEGKTITAALAAGAAALAGVPVHVVTVNDYLAERDAETLGPLYAALGLRVGLITHDVPRAARRAVYQADIVYASNKEIAFDYLRDRLTIGSYSSAIAMKAQWLTGTAGQSPPVMRGLHFAIVDEADSVLIDEARTPLILSGETDAEAERLWAEEALSLADQLVEHRDWRLLANERRIELTGAGCDRLKELGNGMGGVWTGKVRREDAMRKALAAKTIYRRDEHYMVRDGKVEIIDEYTGRVMADRSWSDGLHQLIEMKEGCEVTARKLTLARMTYQRFFRRYRRLAGMTGTASETAGEFWAVYRLRVARIPPNAPKRLMRHPASICRGIEEKLQLVAQRASATSQAGRPVLIGARSVAAAHGLSAALAEAGVDHVVLSADNDRAEADIIALAGQAGRVTVATNIAGRGVDIKLGPGVVERGGLHVILTERHDAGRIDRQLEGRTARRGEPGSTEAVLSLADPLLEIAAYHPLRWVAGPHSPTGRWAALRLLRAAQRRAERMHFQARRDLLKHDTKLGEMLAFSGRGE